MNDDKPITDDSVFKITEHDIKDHPIFRMNERGQICAHVDGDARVIIRRLINHLKYKGRSMPDLHQASKATFVEVFNLHRSTVGTPPVRLELGILSNEEKSVLDDVAAKVAGNDGCKVVSIDGCWSCTAGVHGDSRGSICYIGGNAVTTTCSPNGQPDQCWGCSVECES